MIMNKQEEGVIIRSKIDNKILFINTAASLVYA